MARAMFAISSALLGAVTANQWKDWWTYEGFSGPDFWGLVNSEWRMCAKGLQQSPINIDPSLLLFDPNLAPLVVDKAPMQLLGFNRDLYSNFSEAKTRPQGLLGLSVMIDLLDPRLDPDNSNLELKKVTGALRKIRFKGEKTELKSLSVQSLLPDVTHYITYEGSLTYPGYRCYETVTWILLNKPIYLTEAHMKVWQNSLEKTAAGAANSGGKLGDNFRPLKDLNTRLLRTNINFRTKVHQLIS